MHRILPAAMAFILVSCGIPKAATDNQSRTIDAPSAKQSLGDSGVAFSQQSSSQNPEEYKLSLEVDNKTIDIAFSQSNGFSNFDGHGAVLTEQDKAALAKAAEVFAQNQKLTEASPYVDQVTYKAMDYLANAPANFVFDSHAYQHQLSLKDEGVSCIKKGSNLKAEWSTQAASYVSEYFVVGSAGRNSAGNTVSGYGCMGRCGADCGHWWIPSGWTKDCLDHDACSLRNSASGGSSDPNCGDEYTEAADDWVLAVSFGCGG